MMERNRNLQKIANGYVKASLCHKQHSILLSNCSSRPDTTCNFIEEIEK